MKILIIGGIGLISVAITQYLDEHNRIENSDLDTFDLI